MTAHWTLTDTGLGSYTFWATLWGDPAALGDIDSDSRWNTDTATVYTRVYHMGAGGAKGAAGTTMQPGEWFSVEISIDNPGGGRALPYYYSTTNPGEGIRRMEDTGNVAAWKNGSDWQANYWYMAYAEPWAVRYDPAVIQVNSTFGASDPPGTGNSKFNAKSGTLLMIIYDDNLAADRMNQQASGVAVSSNSMGFFKHTTIQWPVASFFYPNPCGDFAVNPVACNPGWDGYANADWIVGRMSLMAKWGASGLGSRIQPPYDTAFYLAAGSTLGSAYIGPDFYADVPRSGSWPEWCEQLPQQSCVPGGQYNLERTYICVQ
jgi:hypothetical protein